MKTIPSEFAGFIRDVGVRAFDRLAERLKENAASRRAVLRSWGKLSQDDKESLIDELIASAQADSGPAAESAAPPSRAKKSVTKKPAARKRSAST
ncbi:MAG: hypothetical protein ABIO78_09050 [Thermoanaerobaculia bacterium]